MTRRFVVGGNWKMNGNFESINELTSSLLQYPIPPETGNIILGSILPHEAIYRSLYYPWCMFGTL